MAKSLYGVEAEQPLIWVYIELEEGMIERVSLELLAKGRDLADGIGWPVVGLLTGDSQEAVVEELNAYGADEVLLIQHPLLEHFTVEAYSQALFQAIMERKPSLLLFGATPNGRDLAGRLAVRLRTGLNADCTELYLPPETGVLVSEVSGFGGGVLAMIEMRDHRPQMATVRPGVFRLKPPDYAKPVKISQFPAKLSKEMITTRIIERVKGKSVDLSQASVLIAGGRGIDGDFEMLRELAELLGGEVGATRPPVDEGHIERERQIGQTGVICRPKVAIVSGISGAFHFVVGIQEAESVIAINSDPEAPIFEFADFCVVGDAHQIIPALIKTLRSGTGEEKFTSPQAASLSLNSCKDLHHG